jgi:hypothetical protein
MIEKARRQARRQVVFDALVEWQKARRSPFGSRAFRVSWKTLTALPLQGMRAVRGRQDESGASFAPRSPNRLHRIYEEFELISPRRLRDIFGMKSDIGSRSPQL